MSQLHNICFRFRNIVKSICVGILSQDKINTHIFKGNSYMKKNHTQPLNNLYKSIATYYVGRGAYEYSPKIEELIHTHNSMRAGPMSINSYAHL